MTQDKTSVSPSARVLLVDDDDDVRDMMSATLDRKGFDVIQAANVTESLKLITTESFDVLITDLHMPNSSDGFAVVTAMRKAPAGCTFLRLQLAKLLAAGDCTWRRTSPSLLPYTQGRAGSSCISGRRRSSQLRFPVL